MLPNLALLVNCPHCSVVQDASYSHCGQCGLQLLKLCISCRRHSPSSFRCCGHCGVMLDSADRSPQPVQTIPAPVATPQAAYVPYQAVQQPVQPPVPVTQTLQQVVATPVPTAPAVVPQPQVEPILPEPALQPEPTPEPAVTQPEPVAQTAEPVAKPVAETALTVPVTPNLPAPQAAKPLMQSAVARASERRTVAVLFCDVCGFTAMSEKLDPEEVSNIIQPLFQLCNNAINKYGGVIEKFIGDALMAIFGVPVSHEDDAERAAMAALEMRDIIQTFGADLEKRMGFSVNMRIGLNVGTIVAGSVESGEGKNYQVLGDAINTAARMEQNAKPGNVLVTEEMYRLLKDSFELTKGVQIQAKGKAGLLQAYDLVGIRRLQQSRRGFESRVIPFVGRTEEAKGLKARSQTTLQQPQADFVLITGDSGLGKSRLAAEVYSRLTAEEPNLTLIISNATSYSRNFSYFVLQNLLRSMLSVDETISHADVQESIKSFLKQNGTPNAAMIGNLLEYLLFPHLEIPQLKLLTPDRLQQQIFKAVSDVLLGMAQHSPLFIQIDDLQWCDPLSLQWLAAFQKAAHSKALPILVCVTSRSLPEEASTLTWQLQVALDPLSEDHCLRLISHIMDTPELPAHLQGLFDAVLLRALGNPFYIEEVFKNLFDDGLLLTTETGWKLTCALKDLPLPGSIQRLLMTRFDRLPEQQRHLLQSLSAIGNSAPLTLVHSLLQDQQLAPGQIEAELEALVQAHFIAIERGKRDAEIVFKQALTQEVIYNTMVNRRKRALHQQIGETLEATHQGDLSQVMDLLAYHFARTTESLKAIRYLSLSADQAARLYANAQALEHYAQILELLKALEPQALISTDLHNKDWQRASKFKQVVIQRQCEVLLMTGAYEQVLTLVEATLNDDLSHAERARLLYCKGRVLEKRSEFETASALYHQARELVESPPDPAQQARFWNAIGWVSRWMNKYDEALSACQQALDLLELHPDMEQIAYAHNVMGVVCFYQHEWDKALAHYGQSLEIQERIQDLWGRANSLNNLASVYSMINRWDEAIAMFKECIMLREQLGDLDGMSHGWNNLGHAYQELNQLPDAEIAIRQALNLYRQIENTLGVAVAQCNLGTVCFRQKQWQPALELLNAGIQALLQRNLGAMVSEALNHRIEIHLECQEIEQARSLLDQDSESIREHGDPIQKGRLERLWGKYHWLRDDLTASSEALQKSLELLQAANHPSECQLLYQDLVALHQRLGSAEAAYWEDMLASNQAENLSKQAS